jgi:hypothetical protein
MNPDIYKAVELPDQTWRAWVVSETKLSVIERNRDAALASIRQLHLDKIEADRRLEQLGKKIRNF